MNNQIGFSILELLVALTIASVLLTVANSSMRTIQHGNGLSALADRLHSAMSLARSTAISANSEVTICQRDGLSLSCNDNGSWHDGWLVWADLDDDDLIEPVNQNGQQEIIASTAALPTDIYVQLQHDLYRHQIVFNPLGEAHNELRHVTQAFHLCDSRLTTPTHRKIIYLNGSGQAWQQNDRHDSICTHLK